MGDFFKRLLVTGMGTGLLRPAPGTWGSAGACAAVLLAGILSNRSVVAFNVTAGVIIVISSISCVALGRFMVQAFGRKDPSQCTIDEWAGQSVAFLALPLTDRPALWLASVGVAFVLFRIFDIIKPTPIRQLEALPFGWGVLADDLLAGVYANVCAQLLLRLWIVPAYF